MPYENDSNNNNNIITFRYIAVYRMLYYYNVSRRSVAVKT